MQLSFSVAAAALLACSGWAQAAPSFEVASVKAVTGPREWREPKAGVDRIDFPNVTLRYCLAFAYGLKEYQVSGPSWINEQRYDVLAKAPEGTTKEQLPQMMQALLAQRLG